MSDMFGGSIPKPDWDSYFDQSQGLYQRALEGVKPSESALEQVGKMRSQMIPQSYNTGLARSTLLDQALSQGGAEAVNQDAQRQIGAELGLMGQMGQADIARQTAKAQQGMAPYNFLGEMLGMGAGAYFGGPFGMLAGQQAANTLFR